MSDKPENVKRFRRLLPRGAQNQIARRLGICHSAVSQALDKMNPTHEAVQEAVRIIQKSRQAGAGETEKFLRELLDTTESSSLLAVQTP